MNTTELARRAAEEGLLDVAYATVDAPFGRMLVAVTPQGLVRTAFETEHADDVLEELARPHLTAGARGPGPPGRRSPRARRVLRGPPHRASRRRSTGGSRTASCCAPGRHAWPSPTARCAPTPSWRPPPAARTRCAPPGTPWPETRSRSSCPATACCARAGAWAATAAGSSASAGCSTSSRAPCGSEKSRVRARGRGRRGRSRIPPAAPPRARRGCRCGGRCA